MIQVCATDDQGGTVIVVVEPAEIVDLMYEFFLTWERELGEWNDAGMKRDRRAIEHVARLLGEYQAENLEDELMRGFDRQAGDCLE